MPATVDKFFYTISPPINFILSGTEPIEKKIRESAYPAVKYIQSINRRSGFQRRVLSTNPHHRDRGKLPFIKCKELYKADKDQKGTLISRSRNSTKGIYLPEALCFVRCNRWNSTIIVLMNNQSDCEIV
uniref:Uncharacterized protein n=1 Tax=Vespula pensylvanica TaxID=30213 RepID=A0A834JLJ9_VESPE|nr:hypothetical protein H0235_017514 [Vespula pensylvanica]